MELEALMLALKAATVLAPMLGGTVSAIEAALAPTNPAPVSADQAASIFTALEAAVSVAPAIESLIPLVKQAFSGQQMNDADLATLKLAADQIDSAVSARVATLEAENPGAFFDAAAPAPKPAPVPTAPPLAMPVAELPAEQPAAPIRNLLMD